MRCMICKTDVNENMEICPNCGASPWKLPESFLNGDQHKEWLEKYYNPQLKKWQASKQT